MRRDLTHAPRWGRNAAHAHASATNGGLARLALAAVLALAAALALATPASAFTQVTSFDGSRTPAGAMLPERVSVDLSTGDVYVIDPAADVVDRFNRYGRYLSQLTGAQTTAGTFGFDNFADHVAVDNSSTSTQGNVYVVGEAQGTISAFRSDGTFLWQVNDGFSVPNEASGVAVDPTNGDLWVADQSRGAFQISPVDGSRLPGTPIGFAGTGSSLANLAFDSRGNLYASAYEFPLVKYAPPIADPPVAVGDPNAAVFDIAVDLTTDEVYATSQSHMSMYDRTGAQDPASPVIPASQAVGVAVDGPVDRIYVADDTRDVTIWAHNSPPTMDALTVTVGGVGTGSVDADHLAIAGCTRSGGVCTDRYEDGDTVTLTATPDPGMAFIGWSGPDAGSSCLTTAPCTVSMNAAKSITATFDVQHFRLTVTPAGTGSGTVSSPAGIDCGATCSAIFDGGRSVTLTAMPATGSTFAGWAGSGCSGTGTCHVSMTADEGVTATFNQKHPDVGTGSVSGVTDTAATVGGTVNPNGSNVTDCHVDYGTSQSYGSIAACSPSPGAASSAVTVSGSLSGLAQGTTYHYRVVATNGGGTTDGSDATFTTTTTIRSVLTCPLDLSLCPRPNLTLDGFSSKTMLLRLTCHGFAGQPACGGRLTFKAVVNVRIKRGRKTRIVKKTIVVSSVSYTVAAGSTGTAKVGNLTSAAKSALKQGALTARCTNPNGTIKLPKTKVKKARKRH